MWQCLHELVLLGVSNNKTVAYLGKGGPYSILTLKGCPDEATDDMHSGSSVPSARTLSVFRHLTLKEVGPIRWSDLHPTIEL